MNLKHKLLTVGLVLIGFLVWWQYHSTHGNRATTFAGSSFHAESEEDLDSVFTEFESFMKAQGFSRSASPSEMDSWAGLHSENSERVWFSHPRDGATILYLYVDLGPQDLQTMIKWEHHSSIGGPGNSQRKALEFALAVDDWIFERPETNKWPGASQRSKRQWITDRIEKLR